LAKEHLINAELLSNIVVLPYLCNGAHTFLDVLGPVHNLEQAVHLRIHWVLKHDTRQQIRQALALRHIHTRLNIKFVKANNGIVHQLHEGLDFYHKAFDKLLVFLLLLFCALIS
jgi:hypothetical protein